MTVIVRYRAPKWMRRIEGYAQNVAHTIGYSAIEYMYDHDGRRPARWRVALWAAHVVLFDATMAVACAVMGCDLVDDDPGDPECGPQPRVYCIRCGR